MLWMGRQCQCVLQERGRFLRVLLLCLKAGQVLQKAPFDPVRHPGLHNPAHTLLAHLDRLREYVVVQVVLCEMLLIVLIATAWEGCIQRPPLSTGSEAPGGGQVLLARLPQQDKESGKGLCIWDQGRCLCSSHIRALITSSLSSPDGNACCAAVIFSMRS
jgi:hypothetical protein